MFSAHERLLRYSVEHVAGEGQPAQAARPNIVRIYRACAVCRCVLVRIYGGVFVRDSGRKFFIATFVASYPAVLPPSQDLDYQNLST